MPPRNASAIFDAVLALLAERGYAGLTIEGAAARSGVNKTTIYRWWPSKAALVGAALDREMPLDLRVADAGSLAADLAALARAFLDLLTTPPAADAALAILGAAAEHPELAFHVRAFFATRLGPEHPVFARAVARNELPPAADPLLLADAVIGTIWSRVVFRGLRPDPDFPAHLTSLLLPA
ncbi:Bacterial regulatory protein, tetR family [Actinomadura rubteroloni]|uniref:Bacterial regulatory protein, tetR family n=1 Tax=Actinomadura rubteroloni TaxID=1926885 RepID=A0A2P4UGS8_9ACTN|nr:TetR/AcrR family transcriptional regulator [Actinomadura rubteroloni]POM24230.1 Bacterial regulatory protein, tetR family [Actinomadura rubteroloni]